MSEWMPERVVKLPGTIKEPYLKTPGHYWIVICTRSPFMKTFKQSEHAQRYADLRGSEWLHTVFIDSTNIIRPIDKQQLKITGIWPPRHAIYDGRCVFCPEPIVKDVSLITEAAWRDGAPSRPSTGGVLAMGGFGHLACVRRLGAMMPERITE